MTRLISICLALFVWQGITQAQGTVSATYTSGHISTSYNAFDSTCNGNNILLQVTLPAGDAYPVTGIDISYNMRALGSGQMAHQRSQVKCVNTNTTEASVYSGVGAATGVYNYSRNNVSIANGNYAGGTILNFEMHAWRSVEVTAGCHNNINRVVDATWTITVHYGAVQTTGKTGINTSSPASVLDVNGKLKLGDDIVAPQAGMVRWNSSSNDFEGYNGTIWLSLTNKGGQNGSWGNNTATEDRAVTSTDGSANDYLGSSVSISGNYAIAGAYNKTVGGNAAQGRAYIFIRSNNRWDPLTILTASDGAAGDKFGGSVSISGDYAIVGAEEKTVGANADQGKSYIFYRSGSTWTEQAILTASDGAAGDEFGVSVSINGDYAIVGAYHNDVGANVDQGKSYIFIRNGSSWTEQAMLTASDEAANDYFGASVEISENYAIIGAYNKTVGVNSSQGKAYIFNRSGTTWAQQAILTSNNGAANDHFGRAVSISGNYALVGAGFKTIGSYSSHGSAYIFIRSGATWTQQAILTPSDGAGGDYFGLNVSISGDYALIASHNKTIGPNYNQGKAYVFKRTDVTWSQQAMLTASDPTGDYFGDGFGSAVGILGNTIIIGAPNKNEGSNANQGKVYFFTQY